MLILHIMTFLATFFMKTECKWVERFTADEPTPEEIMEIRAREGTLLDDLREAGEGVKGFPHELTEADEDDYVHACYDNQGLDEVEAFDREALEEMKRRADEFLTLYIAGVYSDYFDED